MKKLIRCGDPSTRGDHRRCGSPLCPACRDRNIRRQRKLLEARYQLTPAEDLGSFSAVLGVAGRSKIEDIGVIWKNRTKAIRNRVDYERRRSPAWNAVELKLWLEVDSVHIDQLPLLGELKQRQIAELYFVPFDADGVLWIVTAHGIIHTGPDLSVDEVTISLTERTLPRFKQLHIGQLSNEKAVGLSIYDIVNYSLKSQFKTTSYDQISDVWSSDQMLEYALWVDAFSSGFQSITMKMGGASGQCVYPRL
ncbi:hypothetical protein [Methylobacterium sp. D48H]